MKKILTVFLNLTFVLLFSQSLKAHFYQGSFDTFLKVVSAQNTSRIEAFLRSIKRSELNKINSAKPDTVFHIAVERTNSKIVQLLIDYGIDVDVNEKGHTALHSAVNYNRLDMVRALINNGADPNIKNSNGMTPLFLALHFGHIEIIKTLIVYEKTDLSFTDKEGRTFVDIIQKRHPHLLAELEKNSLIQQRIAENKKLAQNQSKKTKVSGKK